MPFTNGPKQNSSVNTTVLAIVALTLAGVVAVLGVLVFGGQSASAERTAAIVAAVFGFITPTIAALLAFLRATDATATANDAAQAGIVAATKAETVSAKVDEIHDVLKQANGGMDERVTALEQKSP